MEDDILFCMKDSEAMYTPRQIEKILAQAETQGHPLGRGSYLESMTVKQLAHLNEGVYDA